MTGVGGRLSKESSRPPMLASISTRRDPSIYLHVSALLVRLLCKITLEKGFQRTKSKTAQTNVFHPGERSFKNNSEIKTEGVRYQLTCTEGVLKNVFSGRRKGTSDESLSWKKE